MLTRFFGKSAPLNFVLLSVAILCGCSLYAAFHWTESAANNPLGTAGAIFLLLFMVLLLDFIIRKNRLNANNNFAIFLYAAFVLMIPQTVLRPQIALASVFVLLALRRIFSLYSSRNIEKKILDASIWVGLACFFSFYCIGLLALLYYAIISRAGIRITLLSIPLLGLMALALVFTASWLLLFDSFEWYRSIAFDSDFSFAGYQEPELLLPLSLLIVSAFLAVSATFFKLRSLNRKRRPFYAMFPLSILLLLFISLSLPEKNGSEWLLVVPMLSAGLSVFVKKAPRNWIAEGLLWLLLLGGIGRWFV